MMPGFGVGTTDQRLPFQDSTKILVIAVLVL